jgi:hypothetical protein
VRIAFLEIPLTMSSTSNNTNTDSVLDDYESYAKWVTQAYAKMKERREQTVHGGDYVATCMSGCESDVLSSPMYTRYYGTNPNTTNKDTTSK